MGVGFWLCCLGFVLGDTWLFALTYSPTCGNSQSKTIRFDDRLSLERARHELKKKRPRRPVWDNPRGQLPGTGIRSDGENLYGGNLYGGSAQGVSGTSSGGVAVTGESSSQKHSLPVNLLGNGSGGASSGGQAGARAGEGRPSLFSDSGNRLPHFNPFAAAFASLGPAERYEAEFMGASEFLNRTLNEEFQRAFEAGIPSSAIYPSPEIYHIGTPSDRTTSEGFRSALSHGTSSVPSHPTSSPVSFGPSTPV